MDNITLDEIIKCFKSEGCNIYRLDADTLTEMIVVVDSNGYVLITFEPIDDTFTVYDDYYDNVKFSEVAHLWADTIAKLA